MQDKIARYQEIERRGLLSSLPQEKQDLWAEYKRRNAPQQQAKTYEQLVADRDARIKAGTQPTFEMPEVEMGSPIAAGLEGFAKGGLVGAEKVLSGLTLGGYEALGDKLGLNVTGREQEISDLTGGASDVVGLVPEIGANIVAPGALLMKGAGRLGLSGAKALGAVGAAEGGAYGLTGSMFDETQSTPAEILKGAAIGGATGFVAPSVIKGVGSVAGKIADTGASALNKLLGKGANKAYDDSFKILRKELGAETFDNLLKETSRTGRSILEVGDENVVGFAKNVLANSPQARATFTAKAKELAGQRGTQARETIDKALGKTSKYEGLEQIEAAYKSQAKPLYSELQKTGNIEGIDDFIKGNETVSKAVNQVKSNFPELKTKDNASFDVINEARKVISAQTRSPDASTGYFARNALEQLDSVINQSSIGDTYQKARKLYSDGFKVEAALDTGTNFLKSNILPDDISRQVSRMSKAEKDAMTIGVRNTLNGEIGKFVNETQALKKLLPENTRDKLKAMVGKERADSILEFAESELKSQRNLNELLKQSQTAELQSMQRTPILQSAFKAITSPVQTAENLLMKAGGLPTQAKYGRLTDLLVESNPENLQSAHNRVINNPSNIINQNIQEMLYRPSVAGAGVVNQ